SPMLNQCSMIIVAPAVISLSITPTVPPARTINRALAPIAAAWLEEAGLNSLHTLIPTITTTITLTVAIATLRYVSTLLSLIWRSVFGVLSALTAIFWAARIISLASKRLSQKAKAI